MSNKIIFFSISLFLILSLLEVDLLYATARKLNPAAHVHGVAEVTIAFDKEVGKIEFKIATESILGFEHKAKSESEIKIQSDALMRFETKINEMIFFEPNLECQLTKNTIEIIYGNEAADAEKNVETKQTNKNNTHQHGHKHKHEHHHTSHSDFTASFDIKCKKSPLGTRFSIDFTQNFPKVKSIEATALVDQLQISKKVKSSMLEMKLSSN